MAEQADTCAPVLHCPGIVIQRIFDPVLVAMAEENQIGLQYLQGLRRVQRGKITVAPHRVDRQVAALRLQALDVLQAVAQKNDAAGMGLGLHRFLHQRITAVAVG